jgi:transposase
VAPTERTPDHSSLTRICQRLPLEVHLKVFQKVVESARECGLPKGKTIAIDATMTEANAAMKSIVRKHTGEDGNTYLERLAKEAGSEEPTAEDLRKFDKGRRGKTVSNQDWGSPTDPDARITRMKDGRTHLAYKAEHAVDLETELVLSATVQPADRGDPPAGRSPSAGEGPESLPETLVQAQVNAMGTGRGWPNSLSATSGHSSTAWPAC